MDYEHGRFSVAIDALATGKGDLRERLYNAIISGLQPLKEDDVPEDLRQQLTELQETYSLPGAIGDEGRIKATLDSMDDDQLGELARKIVSLGLKALIAHGRSLGTRRMSG